jgi:O-antigen/teichoic acid export membrane protein
MAHYIRKVGLTVFINGLSTFVTLISAAITVRLLLRAVGTIDYGLLMLVSSVVGFISFSDFGTTTAVANQISYFFAEKKHTDITELFSGTAFFLGIIILGIWGILAILFLTKAISMQFLFGVDTSLVPKTLYLFFIILFFTSANFLFNSLFVSLYSGLNELPRYNLINFIYVVLNSVLFIIFLLYKPSIITVALFQGVSIFIRLIFYIIATKLFFKWLKISYHFRLIKKVFPLLKYSIVFVALSLCNSLIGKTDLLVISHILGLGMVAIYSISDRLFRLPANLLQLADPASPTIAMEYKKNNIAKLATMYVQIVRMHTIARVTVFSFLLLYARQIISIWAGAHLYYGNALFIGIFISFFLYTWVGPHFVFINAMFKHTKTLVPVVLSAIINLGASILLAQRIGLVGVILGTIIGNVTTTVIYLPWVLKKILPIHPLAELLKIIGSFIVPALVMGTAYFISVHYVSSIWLQLALGTLNFAVYAGC